MRAKRERCWWLSWWDDPSGPDGKRLPRSKRDRLQAWVTGYKGVEDDGTFRVSRCARVQATSVKKAWELVDVMYPGASSAEVRFAEEVELTWWPPADRFPPHGAALREAK